MPGERTVFRWLAENEEFRQQYARAREFWADAEFDNMLAIADTPVEGTRRKVTIDDDGESEEILHADMVEHRKLQVNTRQWALARMSPRKYGELIKNEITNPDGSLRSGMSEEQATAKLELLRQELTEKWRAKNAGSEHEDGTDLV